MPIRPKLPDALLRALANPVAGRIPVRGPGIAPHPPAGPQPGPLPGPFAGLAQRARQASAGLPPRARVDFAALAAVRQQSSHMPDFGLQAVGRQAAEAARAQFQARLELIAQQLGTAPRHAGTGPAAPPPPDSGKQLRPPGEAAREAMGWGSEQGAGGGGGAAHAGEKPKPHPPEPVGADANTGGGMGEAPPAPPASAAPAAAADPATPVARSQAELAALRHLGLRPDASDHEILGVPPDAARVALAKARARRLRAAHPDKQTAGAADTDAGDVIELVEGAFARLTGRPPAQA